MAAAASAGATGPASGPALPPPAEAAAIPVHIDAVPEDRLPSGVDGPDIASGSGSAGLDARIAALGGRLTPHHPSGGGTLVRAGLPRG